MIWSHPPPLVLILKSSYFVCAGTKYKDSHMHGCTSTGNFLSSMYTDLEEKPMDMVVASNEKGGQLSGDVCSMVHC